MRSAGRVDPDPVPTPDGTPVIALDSPDFYTTTHALWIDEYLPLDPARGAVLTVANRHVVFAHAIRDRTVHLALQVMLTHTLQQYQDGPGSISPCLYWWRNWTWTMLPYQVSADYRQVRFTPPAAFEQLLATL